MGQQLGRGQNFRFLVKFGRVLIYWFGKVFSAFITLVLSTFLTVSFVVVTTRQVVHNTTAVEVWSVALGWQRGFEFEFDFDF